MTDLKQETKRLLALADAATPGPWAVHPSRAVVVPSPHASRPIGCHENPVIDRETYAQEICALHWPDRNRNESEVRSNANLIAAVPDMATHIRALQAENDRLQGDLKHLREVRDPGGCECSDDDACMFARQRDAFKAECEALRAKSRAFRNRLTQEIAQNKEGEYELRQVEAEYQFNEFEQAFDAAMNRERGE